MKPPEPAAKRLLHRIHRKLYAFSTFVLAIIESRLISTSWKIALIPPAILKVFLNQHDGCIPALTICGEFY
jgi:hypothetical protein